jgi:IS30 family transposase
MILLHLPGGKFAEDVWDAVIAALAPLPPQLPHVVDVGSGHRDGAARRHQRNAGNPVFFCEKASPWQQGRRQSRIMITSFLDRLV